MSEIGLKSSSFSDLTEAKRVLTLEAQALLLLSEGLNESFVEAIDLLNHTKGRVVTTGMGKSGYVARKIAATFASTGTPAFFIHPAEASHGDLGMLDKKDTLLVLSNSGETTELSDLISFAGRHHIPLIGMTFQAESSLKERANVTLVLPKVEEACPLGLAPMTSTTLMMALGDALATVLLKRRGFSKEDFGSLHPGGKLGQRLLKIEKIMHSGDKIPLTSGETSMQDVLLLMTAKGFGCVGIVDKDQNLQGIITDGDLRRHMGEDLLKKTASHIMTPRPRTISKKALAEEAVALMNEKGITSLFIIDPEKEPLKPIGIIHIHDCLRVGML